jgi:hypothetical protein
VLELTIADELFAFRNQLAKKKENQLAVGRILRSPGTTISQTSSSFVRVNPHAQEKCTEAFGINGLALCGKIATVNTVAWFRACGGQKLVCGCGRRAIVPGDRIAETNLFHRRSLFFQK